MSTPYSRHADSAANSRTAEQTGCYHCGLPVPQNIDFPAEIDGVLRAMCCGGCQAVARAIVDAGLSDYYRHRDAMPESPREALPQALQDMLLFDHPAVQKSFVRPAGEHEREADLILEGITCSACVWLNEEHLARQPGVTAVNVNYATHRARVRWDENRIKLSQILGAIAAIGYRAHPYDVARSEQLARQERRAALWRLFVAGFGMMQVMMYAIPVYLAEAGTMTADIEQLMRWASLILTLPVVAYSAAPFFRNAWRDLGLRRVGMDVPVALGVGAAFAASVWATLRGNGAVYFDSVTMFVFLLLGGRYLEMLARHRAARGIETLARATPAFAWRVRNPPNLDAERVAVADLVSGDTLLVKPGETVPADGGVIDGESAADESLLTGESLPVAKRPGNEVIGGSLNIGSQLVMTVSRVGADSRLGAIRRLMEQAAGDKPHLVQLADRIAAHFVAAVLLLALVTGGVWYFVDPSRALWVFVSVLVVSCPCALSLATPAALTVATGAMAARGLLVARGRAIETLARVTRLVFDKTGTLTTGRLNVVEALPCNGRAPAEITRLAAAMEQGSEHPLATALRGACESAAPPMVDAIRIHTGAGVSCQVKGRAMRLGSIAFVAGLHGQPLPERIMQWQASDNSVVALADEHGWMGFFRLSDTLRDDAVDTVGALARTGLRLTMLSGDSAAAARHVAAQLGIADVEGGLSPEDKHARLKRMQEAGEAVAMVGDGVNDAPVLAQAQVSIAMGGGADLARTRADIVLLGDRLAPLADGVTLARRTLFIMRQNLAWAFGYNLLAIPLAMAGWVTPWMAGIGMSASSLLVVLNALRLQR